MHSQSLNIGLAYESGCLTEYLFSCSVLGILFLKMVRDYYYYVILHVLDEILLKRLFSAIENAITNLQFFFLFFNSGTNSGLTLSFI